MEGEDLNTLVDSRWVESQHEWEGELFEVDGGYFGDSFSMGFTGYGCSFGKSDFGISDSELLRVDFTASVEGDGVKELYIPNTFIDDGGNNLKTSDSFYSTTTLTQRGSATSQGSLFFESIDCLTTDALIILVENDVDTVIFESPLGPEHGSDSVPEPITALSTTETGAAPIKPADTIVSLESTAPVPTTTPSPYSESLIAMRSWRDEEEGDQQFLWLQSRIDTAPVRLSVEVSGKDLSISPDRRHIAVADSRELRIVDTEGTELLYIDYFVKRVSDIRMFYINGLAWSSNSKLLVAGYGYPEHSCVETIGCNTDLLSYGIYEIDIYTGNTTLYFNTTEFRQVLHGMDRDVDGQIVISLQPFHAQFGEHPQLWILDSDSNSLNRLTYSTEMKTSPRWSPDGTKIFTPVAMLLTQ